MNDQKGLQLDFFPKAVSNSEETIEFIGDLYSDAIINITNDEPVPRKKEILLLGWDNFENWYLPFILKGHGNRIEEDFRNRIEEYGYDFMHEELAALREYNAGYQTGYHYKSEDDQLLKYLNDISKSLDYYQLSYLNIDEEIDDGENLPLRNEDLYHAWINPPIRQVW